MLIVQQIWLNIYMGKLKYLKAKFFGKMNQQEKNNLLKIVVTSKPAEAVDGSIQEQKHQKPLAKTKEKECCIIDTMAMSVSTIISSAKKIVITTTVTLIITTTITLTTSTKNSR